MAARELFDVKGKLAFSGFGKAHTICTAQACGLAVDIRPRDDELAAFIDKAIPDVDKFPADFFHI